MKRKVLLVEPKYKNKYPPMGLMKIATYHKQLGDEVSFFKGSFREFMVQEIYEELVSKLYRVDNAVEWAEYKKEICEYVVKGLKAHFELLTGLNESVLVASNLEYYRKYYIKKEYLKYPKWDRVFITTLFTFYWKDTIDTINAFKGICKDVNEVKVGGIAASVVPDDILKETGIKPFEGLLDKGGEYDDNGIIIDHLPLDYSILEEIDYVYPENKAFFGYMTRGCVNRCPFCAVPQIEPTYNEFISIREQVEYTRKNYGDKRSLLLLDNNVMASKQFDSIIDEIKACGFTHDKTYLDSLPYEVAYKGLLNGINERGYKKRIVKEYGILLNKLTENDQKTLYKIINEYKLRYFETATKESIIRFHDTVLPYFKKMYRFKAKVRYVDFNQGVDARLITNEKMKKLSEIPIKPLRIAFDDWKLRNQYEQAVRSAATYGILNMSNYILYNYNDEPVDLYRRLKLNIELCEELNVNIYSFPMKYHPIKDPQYFRSRDYLGKHWNRKFIRAIQAILNSTKGKIGRGKDFFEEAFGKNEYEFYKLLYMPEVMIIYRMHYKHNGITNQWWEAFNSLSDTQKSTAKEIISINNFSNIYDSVVDEKIRKVLWYYTIDRAIAKDEIMKLKENETKDIS